MCQIRTVHLYIRSLMCFSYLRLLLFSNVTLMIILALNKFQRIDVSRSFSFIDEFVTLIYLYFFFDYFNCWELE